MGQVLAADRYGTFVKSSNTIAQLNLSSFLDILLKVGGQQYQSLTVLQLNMGSIGAGGLDTGTIGANTLYYVYAIVNGSSLAIIASTSSSVPAGFSIANVFGFIETDANAAIAYCQPKGIFLQSKLGSLRELSLDQNDNVTVNST